MVYWFRKYHRTLWYWTKMYTSFMKEVVSKHKEKLSLIWMYTDSLKSVQFPNIPQKWTSVRSKLNSSRLSNTKTVQDLPSTWVFWAIFEKYSKTNMITFLLQKKKQQISGKVIAVSNWFQKKFGLSVFNLFTDPKLRVAKKKIDQYMMTAKQLGIEPDSTEYTPLISLDCFCFNRWLAPFGVKREIEKMCVKVPK